MLLERILLQKMTSSMNKKMKMYMNTSGENLLNIEVIDLIMNEDLYKIDELNTLKDLQDYSDKLYEEEDDMDDSEDKVTDLEIKMTLEEERINIEESEMIEELIELNDPENNYLIATLKRRRDHLQRREERLKQRKDDLLTRNIILKYRKCIIASNKKKIQKSENDCDKAEIDKNSGTDELADTEK